MRWNATCVSLLLLLVTAHTNTGADAESDNDLVFEEVEKNSDAGVSPVAKPQLQADERYKRQQHGGGQQHVLDDEDYVDESGSGSGNGGTVEPSRPPAAAAFFRSTITVSSVQFENQLSDRTSPRFKQLSQDLAADFQEAFDTVPGDQVVSVIKFEPSTPGVLATVDVSSIGFDNEEDLRFLLERKLSHGHAGNFLLSPQKFTFRRMQSGTGNCFPDFQCNTGDCIPQHQFCDRIPQCPDGSDEYDCEPVTCPPDTFACDDGECLDERRKCDGHADCPGGEDEMQCPIATTSDPRVPGPTAGGCPSGQFACSSGQCINNRQRCDYVVDCPHGDDESFCHPCKPNQWRCTDGSCIALSQFCNKDYDCPDFSDENYCGDGPIIPPTPSVTPSPETGLVCSPGNFRCDNGTCIPMHQRCDGFPDCPDASRADERDCPCTDLEWQCDDGHCISRSSRCNGYVECPADNSDERNCFTHPECASHEFQCQDGKCIARDLQCDSHVDCPDGSDERNCPCRPGQIKCNNGFCIDAVRHCDGYHDCQDGSDETNCSMRCEPGNFRCSDGSCVPLKSRCDDRRDCADGSDEKKCISSPSTPTTCLPDQFRCSDGLCLTLAQRCDGIEDCINREDERGCGCTQDQFRCSDGACIDSRLRCNGRADCNDRSDESGCGGVEEHVPTCSPSDFVCDNGETCLDPNLKCDRKYDCADGMDELICDSCPFGYICNDANTCIPNEQKCDGKRNCPAGEDEIGCEQIVSTPDDVVDECQAGYFRCGDKSCIPEDRRCDRRPDCRDGADEENCECEPNEFECDDGTCIPAQSQCDGRYDCHDRSDELPCPGTGDGGGGGDVNGGGGNSDSSGECGANKFQCKDGSCIDEEKRCNEFPECPDYSDEYDCTQCKPGFMSCNDGTCVDVRRKCDGRSDCRDRSDEEGCDTAQECRSDQFKCNDGSCIDKSLQCNNQPDCRDGSDEADCEFPVCSPDDLICGDGRCVPHSKRCDGRFDCIDGSDERDCVKRCERNEFRCDNGQCVDTRRQCDGHFDCSDRSDEKDCPCREDEFPCGEGVCIPLWNVCDGVIDCADHSDELRCDYRPVVTRCAEGEFQCGDGLCIDDRRRCDRRYDCLDGTDEFYCGRGCQSHEFQCSDGSCIDERLKCNNRRDCRDNSDEDDCEIQTSAPRCPPGYSPCRSGHCVHSTAFCDGRSDCIDRSDEENCDGTAKPTDALCGEQQFQCDGDTCLDNSRRCDNVYDCNDFSDEQNCESFLQCAPGEYRCDNGQCIASHRQCDNNYDCSDFSDEFHCGDTCRPGQFACGDDKCIEGSSQCDGKADCSDYSDEQNCKWRPCRADEFRCENGPCITREHRCDGRYDCPDTTDELDCPIQPFRGSVNLKTYPDHQTIHRSREVVFQCRDEGEQRAPVRWSREGNLPFPPGTTDVHGRLTMPNIQMEHAGTYICSVVGVSGPRTTTLRSISFGGGLGEQTSRSVYLTVDPYQPVTTPIPGVCNLGEATCKNGQCIQQAFVCDDDLDCLDGSDEESCPVSGIECEPNEFQCSNRKCVLKLWVCDGDNDCLDSSDEENCVTNPPGSACRYDEYQCASGNQCIPKSFQCDSQVGDCLDQSDEIGCSSPTVVDLPPATKTVQIGETVVLTCRAIGNPTPYINWRLNWGHIPPPPRVTTTNDNGVGTLTIRDVQLTDQGAYTCEAINNKQSVLGVPDTILVVISTGVCQPPLFNTNARTQSECLRCFCFGVSNQCSSSGNLFVSQLPPPTEMGISPVSLDPSGSYNLQDPQFALDQDAVDFRPRSREFRLDRRVQQGQPRFIKYYFSLPRNYQGDLLNSYGGYLRYTVMYRTSSSSPTSSPDIILKGNGLTITYSHPEALRPGVENPVEARFWEGTWTMLDSKIDARREDIMKVLQNVENFLIRAVYDDNFFESSLIGFSLDTATPQPTATGQQPAVYVEQCTCPPGYTGSSCQNCASGHSRVSTGRDLGECRPTPSCNCHGHSSTCNDRGECDRCEDNTEGRQCERCRPGFYGDARRGSSADCQPCPCPLNRAPNQFSPTCFLDQDGQVTCDACDEGYGGRRCEKCSNGYTGDPLIPGDSCRPVTAQCNSYGSSSQTPSPVTGLCQCKSFVTGPKCGDCKDASFHLNPHSPGGCIPCFCMGITRNCSSCSQHRSQQTASFDRDDTQGFTLGSLDGGDTVDQDLEVNTDQQELVYNNFYYLPREKTYYWNLPDKFLGNRMSSYGGYLNYTIRYSGYPSTASQDPDVQIQGNRITLDYFHHERLTPNTPNTISVAFFEQNWRRSDGQATTREHLMMALADLKVFAIKASYSPDAIESSISNIIIDTAEDRPTGQQRAYEVEKCNCPPGYKGLSCEECDSGFKRTGGGLYLGLCEPCFCNGHSSDCDAQTGVCRNCQHNTHGDYCETCQPGFTGDASGNTPYDCRPSGPGDHCRCSIDGSESLDCDSRGQCQCKFHTEGRNCDRCKEGFFNLEGDNPEGCTACYCSGVANRCTSSSYYRTQVQIQMRENQPHGVTLITRNRERVIVDGIVSNPHRNEIGFRAFPQSSSSEDALYWSLPEQFLGNKLTSYGGVLKFVQRYLSQRQGESYDVPDVIIAGKKSTITYTAELPLQPDEGRHNIIDLHESVWELLEDRRTRPISRDQFLATLSNVEAILVRASFNTRMLDSVLGDVSLDSAVPGNTGQGLAVSIEQCSCPPGYTGLSCEECSAGYNREPSGRCSRCNCHGHSSFCDSNTGLCSRCEHNTDGLSCEKCARGYYGDATRGTSNDCKPCPCPLTSQPNQFSPTCRLDSDGRPTCDACPSGYAGRNCEQCAPGYRGDPSQPGGQCRAEANFVEITPQRVELPEGAQVNFTCSVRSDEFAVVHWFRPGGVPLPSHARVHKTAVGSVLQFQSVCRSDQGWYTCHVTTVNNGGVAGTQLIVVKGGPSISIRMQEPRVARIEEGSTVTFRCTAESQATPTIEWTKDGGRLPDHAYVRDGTLTISSARQEDSGTYICRATDAYGLAEDRGTLLVTSTSHPVIPDSPKAWIEPRFIEAQVGEPIEFRCLTQGIENPSLQWTAGPGGHLSPHSSFHNGVFRIPSARKSDQSEYYCIVTHAGGTENIRTILYIVGDDAPEPNPPTAGPPTPPQRPTISPSTYSARAGETVRFECSPDSSSDRVRISWSKSGADHLPPSANAVDGTLILSNVEQSMSGTYVCSITTSTGIVYAQAQLDVLSGGGQPSAHVEPEQQTASLGQTAEMRCHVSGNPKPTIRWSKSDREMNPAHEVIDNLLRIPNVSLRDRGIYICVAENNLGRAQAVTILEVAQRSPPAIEILPGTIEEVKRGGDTMFMCRATGGTPPPKIQWARADGRPLPRSAELLSGDTVLRFTRVVGDEAGQYVCSAENEAGMITATATLTILGSVLALPEALPLVAPSLPVVRLSTSSPYRVSVGQRIHMECRAEGDPIPSVSWKYPVGRQTYEYAALPRETPGIAILEIHQARAEDSGIYTCSARNSAGTTEERLQLIVEGSALTNPGAITDGNEFVVPVGSRAEFTCYVVGSEVDGLSFTWVRTDNKPLPLGHIMKNGHLTIEHVRKEDAGEYSCLIAEKGVVINAPKKVLHVVAPPRITISPTRQISRPGDSVHFRCNADGDDPISIEWSRVGGSFGPNTFASHGLLQFRGITVQDAGRYLCTAKNPAGQISTPAEVLVNDAADGGGGGGGGDCSESGGQCGIAPDCLGGAFQCTEEPLINIPNREMNVFLGSTVDLPCEVRGTPTPSVMWSKEGGELPFNSRIVDTNLRITSVHIEDGGRYYCIATNDAGSSQDYVNLHVRGLSTLSVRINPSLDVVRLGDTLDVSCDVSGDPSASIWWTRVGGSLPQNSQTAGNLLRISNVQAENGGVYQCQVDTYQGAFTEDYALSIQDIPSLPHLIDEPKVETRTAEFGSTVVMDCRSNLRPPVTYSWIREGNLLPADSDIQGSVLTIPDVRAEDAGTYVCTATNYEDKVSIPNVLTVIGVIPRFSQSPSSFMALPMLPSAYLLFDIEISFKPESQDGLIFYNGHKKGGVGDFLSLGLNGGHVEFRFDVGSGPAVLQSLESIEMNAWHTVRVARNRREGMLSVNNQTVVNGSAPGNFQGLDLSEPFYVGGVPDFNNIHRLSGFTHGFVGCISRLVISGSNRQLMHDAEITSGVSHCNTCAVNPCSHGGTCQEAHTTDGLICICSPGFSGSTCNEVGKACYPGVCGNGRCINRPEGGFDCHCPFGKAGERCERDITIYEPAFHDDAFVAYPTPNTRALRHLKIATRLKPRDIKDGVIVYCGQSENGQGDFISLTLKNKRIEFRFDTGSGPAVIQSKEEMKENEWVEVKAERNHREGSLIVNDGEEVKGRSQGHTRGLNLHLPLYVGGVDSQKITVNPLVEVDHGFDGCISHMEVSGVEVDLINSIVDSANVEDCGGQNACDRHPCSNGGICRDVGPKPTDYQCTCKPGYRGTNCELEDDFCHGVKRCLHDGRCESVGTTYKCHCTRYYTGENCGKKLEYTTSVQFLEDGYLELPRDLMPHSSSATAEVMSLQFKTDKPNGLIFWHGQKPNTEGKGKDFVAVAVVDGHLEFSFALGNGPAVIRSRVRVDDGNEHKVVLRRLATDGSFELDNVFTEYGETHGVLQMLDAAGNIYLGGVPDHKLMTGGRYNHSFVGCLSDLQIQENDALNLQSRSVSGQNVAKCDSTGKGIQNYEHRDNRIE